MKRLLLRMSALTTVIVLGLIAIAQAQRSSGPATSPPAASSATGNAAADVGMPEANPLRFTTPPQNTLPPAAGPAGRHPFVPSNQPTLAPPAERFSLSAATETNMAPPGYSAATTTTPVASDFGGLPPMAQAPQGAAIQPQTAGTAPLGSNAPQVPDFGPPVGIPATNLAAGDVPPNFAGAGAAAISSIPTNQPYQGGASTQPMPGGSLAVDVNPVPQQLNVPNAQPMHRVPARSTFANSPVQPALAGPAMATGTGRPGVKELEGLQTPQLVVEKVAPAEIQVGRPAIFEIHVRNVGPVAASNVVIRDEIPEGTRLENTKPQATGGAQGELVWQLGTLEPNQDVTVEMELMPTDEGNIGSVATVHFETEASVRTRATRPQLAIEIEAADEVLKGEELSVKITVSNPGSGIAENVVLEEHVPPGFRHPQGAELEYVVGDLAPKESRELTLLLEAVHAGPLENVITARGEPSLHTESRRPVEVIAPQLEVAVNGPSKRYLECEAVYNLSVRNPGTAPAKQVEMSVEVPAGMKFVSGTNRAHYEEATRTVHWMLEEIPVQDGPPPVQLTLLPVEPGDHHIRLVSSDDSGVKAEIQQAVHVEGIVAMYFEVADLQDPIEVGSQTLYEIRVVNQGSKEATNVRLVAELPPGLRAVAAEGPLSQAQAAQGNTVSFQPLPRLAAKADVTYRIRVEGVQPGDLRMNVQLTTDEIERPINKEESTRVYSPQ